MFLKYDNDGLKMYIGSKILRASFEKSSFGDTYTGEVYVGFCDSLRPRDEKLAGESFFFINRNSYEEVADELVALHDGAEVKCASFLVENSYMSSHRHKYIITIRDAFYHYLINTVTTILFIAKNDPEAEFWIVTGNTGDLGWQISPKETRKNRDFLSYLLNFHGINHYFLSSDFGFDNYSYLNWNSSFYQQEVGSGDKFQRTTNMMVYPVYRFNNVTVIKDYSMCFDRSLGDITDLIDQYISPLDRITDLGESPRIYISRSGEDETGSAFLDPDNPSLGYKDNNRIHNESKLKEYLESKDFYILETDNMQEHSEQISLLSRASIVIGATGTGLINSLFMQNGKTVVELKLELKEQHESQQLYPYYADYAYARGHKYIALDVSDKQADTAIKELDELFGLLNIEGL